MRYDVAGSGERAIVFIHGFGGFGGLWHWQVDYFKKCARCITVDLPGHGRTPWTSSGLQEMSCALQEILRREGIERPHVVASSFGGLIAMTLLQQDPQKILSLSLIGAPPRFTPTDGFSGGLTSAGIHKLGHQLQGDVGRVLDMFVRSFSTDTERALPQYARVRELRRRASLPDRQALLKFLDILETADLRRVLYEARVPLQMINGGRDYICPMSVIGILKEHLPQARFDIFEEAGHGLFVTMPDECNAVLSEFLGI